MPPETAPANTAPTKEVTRVGESVYKRLMSGLPGYAFALLVCFAIVAVILLITPQRNRESVPVVNYSIDMANLRSAAPYTAYVPEGLPATWKPTSSRLTGTTGSGPVAWHLGFATPGDQYAALEESDEQPAGAGKFVWRMTSDGRPEGSLQVAGVGWDQFFRKDKKQRSLVRRLPGLTLVVTGTASYQELAVLAASLRPQPKPTSTPTPR